MHFRSLIHSAVAAGMLAVLPATMGGTVALRPTPILNVTLPAGLTYQVESSTNGSAWTATGVLVVGTGGPLALRLDGFAAQATYRFAPLDAASFIAPTVTNGWHLAGSFPGAGEVRVETNATLASPSWAHRDFAFPDAAGSFVRALRPPLPSPIFLRGVQPATPLELATLASYSADPHAGAAGFGLVADDMPQLYRDGYICAPCPAFYHRGGANAAAAGECYEFTGPAGTTTVMVGDLDDLPPPGTCDAGRTYFDIGNPAFAALFTDAAGFGTATFRLVPAPVVGNVKMVVVLNSGGFYLELRPYNHRAGLGKLEIKSAGSANWIELPRTVYNSFVYNGGGGALAFPLSVRVTSRFGEVVDFPAIAAMQPNDRFTANAQFAAFPDLAPAPVWILPPVYTDSLSNVLGGQWAMSLYGGLVVNPTYTGSAFQGAASLQISNFTAFSGIQFFAPHRFPRPLDGVLEFAIRSGTVSPASHLAVLFTGFDGGGTAATSQTVALPTLDATWRRLRIPLAPALVPARIYEIRIINNSLTPITSVLLDAISFQQP